MTALARNEAAIFRGRLNGDFKVGFSDLLSFGPLIGAKIDMRGEADLNIKGSSAAVYTPSTLGTERGHLRLDTTTLALGPLTIQTSDGVAVHADASVQFNVPRSARIICKQMEHGVFRGLAVEFARRVESAIGGVVGTLLGRDAIEHQGMLSTRCKADLKARCEGVPDRENGALGIVITSVSLQVHPLDDARDARGANQPFDIANEARRLYRFFQENRLFEEAGIEVALPQFAALLFAVIEKEKVRVITRSGNALIVLPAGAAGLDVGQMDYEQILSRVKRLSAVRSPAGAPAQPPLIEGRRGVGPAPPGADAA